MASVATASSTGAWGQTAESSWSGTNARSIEDVIVTGQKPDDQQSAGTKTATPLVETPQSISVIDGATISELGLQNLNQSLRFVAGVTPETRGASAEVYDQFKLRGFDAPTYLDGLRLFSSATGYAQPQVDVSRIDRIEVVKGPASALYGQSGPGGLIVEESKLPLDRDLYGAVAGTYGTYNLYRVDADVGGRAGGLVAWRLYGSVNGAEDQLTYGRRDRQTVSGAVTLGAGRSTTLTVLAAYSHDPRNGNYGVFPALGTLFSNPNGRISTRFYGGEPNDFFSRNQLGLTYILRQRLGDNWQFRASGRWQRTTSRLGIVYTGGFPVDGTDPAPTLYSRFSYATDEENNAWTYDNQLSGTIATGPLTQTVLLGYDRQVAHSGEHYAFGGATPIDVYDPVYGGFPTPTTPEQVIGYDLASPATVTDAFVRQRQQGVYLQDQLALGGLRVTLSGRQDWVRTAQAPIEKRDDKFTYRVGLLYLTSFGLAPYVNFSTSFQPQPVLLVDGSLANPSQGKQFEAGAKYEVPGMHILVTAAYFNIRQSNVVVSDPVTFSSSQVGRVRSRGVEVEAKAPLTHGFAFNLAYSRQKVKVLDDVDLTRVGLGLATVGRGGASAELEWAPERGPLTGLGIGGAIRHVNSSYADRYIDGVPYNVPGYTVFDGLIRYDLGRLNIGLERFRVGVNATNIFDKKYLTSCFANYGWCWYGQRRRVQATVGFSW